MTKVTMKDDVAPVHVDQKPKFESVMDSRGRTIQLRKLDPLQTSKIVIAIGGELAGNSTYMGGFVIPAAMVVYIDDIGFGLPTTNKQIEAMLGELGEEGMSAISEHLTAKHKKEQEAAALSAEQAAAKN